MDKKFPVALAVMLVLLRLAIGWHFYVEGSKKVQSLDVGKTTTSRPFTSAEFLRGSNGPLAVIFHRQAGDLDREALARLDVAAPPELPPALEKHYDDTFNRFVERLGVGNDKITLSDKVRIPLWGEVWIVDGAERDKEQIELARTRLASAKAKAARWLLGLDREDAVEVVVPSFTTGPVAKVKRMPPERIEAYRKTLAEIRAIEHEELPAFEKPVRKDLKALKTEAAGMRTQLMADLDKILLDRLEEVLTPPQKAKFEAYKREQTFKGEPVFGTPASAMLTWTDRGVSWGLVMIGGCLLLGLFTRVACVAGALFLFSVYLATPPFLSLPASPRQEGFYYLVNKNLIEMLALLALATTPSGRWLGLDSVLHALNPFRKRAKSVAAEKK